MRACVLQVWTRKGSAPQDEPYIHPSGDDRLLIPGPSQGISARSETSGNRGSCLTPYQVLGPVDQLPFIIILVIGKTAWA